jgi:hypothetical protein
VNHLFSKRRAATRIFTFVATLALVLGYSVAAFGQAETGNVNGTITDPSGAVVPKAAVTARNINTGAIRTTQSGGDGNYVVSNLLPGTYAITVEAQGFAKQEKRVEVSVGSRHEMNFQLALTGATVVVEVEAAGGVAVNTETQTLSSVISPEEVVGLPTLTRNPYDFAANVGTASDADPSGRGVGVAFNGLRSSGTNVLLDGAANNDEFTASVGQPVPLDSVQEFSVLTNNYTAEYGRASSAIVNLATKGGTNDWHGSVYEYNRVAALSSNNFLNNAQKIERPVFTRNQFGYSIGGPIIKDKLFFFNNVEWTRIRSSSPTSVWVVDPAFLAFATGTGGATQNYFSSFGTLRSGTSIVGAPVLVSDLRSIGVCTTAPCSAIPATTPFLDELSYSSPSNAGAGNPENYYNIVGRVDYNYSSRTQVYTRYALNKGSLLTGAVANSPYNGFDSGQDETDNSILTSLTHTFSPRFTSQTKFVYNRLNLFQPLGAQPAAPGLYWSPSTTFAGFTNPTTGDTAVLALPGYLPFTPGNGIPFGGPQNFAQLYQDFGFAKGSHNVRFGGSYQYLQDNRTFGAYQTPVSAFGTSGSTITNTNVNRFLNGQLGQFQSAIYPQGNFPCPFPAAARTLVGGAANPNAGQCVDPSTTAGGTLAGSVDQLGNVALPVTQPDFSRSNRYHEFAAYLQDSWKLNARLTLNGGVRWEYFGIQHNVNPNLDSNYYLGSGPEVQGIRTGNVATVPTSPIGGLWRKSWGNFGPRLGMAWDIFGNGKTVFRGGYGISYERNFGNVTFNVIQNPPNYAVISLINGTDTPACTSFNPPTPAGCGIAVTTDVAGPLAGTTPPFKALPATSLRAVNPNIGTAYAHLYSMTLERQLFRNFLVGIDYSGSRGEKLYDIANINRSGSGNFYLGDACATTPCTNPFAYFNTGATTGLTRLKTSQYSNINFRSDGGISKYNAMVIRASMRNWANTGLTLDANYTWSHAFDELSDTFSTGDNIVNLGYLDAFHPKVDLGNAYFDIRQRFTLQAVWDVPFFKHQTGWKKQVFDGWTIAPIFLAETGSPFTIYDCTFAFTVCLRAQTAPGQKIAKSGPGNPQSAGVDTFNYIPLSDNPNAPTTYFYKDNPNEVNACTGNTAATCPLSGYFSNIVGLSDFGPYPASMLPRNQQYGPGYWNVNLGIYKTFFLTERFKLQFRTEMYNAFNHSNMYANVGTADVSAGLSAISSSRGAVDGVPVSVNGIRNIQLALRLTF